MPNEYIHKAIIFHETRVNKLRKDDSLQVSLLEVGKEIALAEIKICKKGTCIYAGIQKYPFDHLLSIFRKMRCAY